MKKITFLLAVLCISVLVQAQTIPAKVYMDFEDGLKPSIAGITFVDGAYDPISIKGGESPDLIPNEVRDESGNKVFYVDYDGYIQIDNSALDFTKPFSVSFKMKYKINPAAHNGVIQFFGNSADPFIFGTGTSEVGPGYGMFSALKVSPVYKEADGTGGSLVCWNNGAETSVLSDDATCIPEKYYHVALTYNNGVGKIYIDGAELQGTKKWAATPSYGSAKAIGLTYHELTDTKMILGASLVTESNIGKDKDANTITGNNFAVWYHKGFTKSVPVTFDNIALFEKELTAQEVSNIHGGTVVPTGINDVRVSSDAIYPNPMADVLFVKEQGVTAIDIYSVAGAKVLSVTNVSSGINVSTLAKGVYLINCIDENGQVIAVQKAIKK